MNWYDWCFVTPPRYFDGGVKYNWEIQLWCQIEKTCFAWNEI